MLTGVVTATFPLTTYGYIMLRDISGDPMI